MELIRYICEEQTIFTNINNVIDLVIGIILCFFSCKCNEKAVACIVGIHGGFWTSFILGILFWVENSVIIGIFGSFLFGAACFINKRTQRFIIGFVATSKILFWVLISTAQEVGHYAVNDKMFCASVIAGIVAGVFWAFAKSEQFLFICYVLIGTGLLVGGISNWPEPDGGYFIDIYNSKSEMTEFISFFYKMNFWDDGYLILLPFICFVGIECQIIMKVRRMKKEQDDS